MNALRSSAQRHRPAEIGVVEGRLIAVDDQVAADVGCRHVADRLRRLALDILQLRDRDAEMRRRLPAIKARSRVDRSLMIVPLDAIEIRPARLPVIRVARHRDDLVRLELDEFEGAGADRMAAHVARRDMARIDRRPARGQQRQNDGCGRFRWKVTSIIAIGGHLFEVVVPGFARVDAQFFARLALQQVPGAFDIRGRERLAVVPFDALAQREGQLGSLLVPRPASGELRARSIAGCSAPRPA